VYNQDDVDALYQCAKDGQVLARDVRVDSGISGALKIRNVDFIGGKIIVEHHPGFEYLELGTDFDNINPTRDAATGLILGNMSALVEISGADATGTFATVELRDLPALTLSGFNGLGHAFPVTIDTLTVSEGTFLGFSINVKDIRRLNIHNQNLSFYYDTN
jgi:hypothetical protein